jgi:UPF0755 protein
MHHTSRFWFRTTAVISTVLLGLLTAVVAGVFLLSSPFKGYPEDSKIVEIPRGTRLVGMADLLAQEGVIRHRQAFLVALALERKKAVIRAGEYSFDRPMSEFEVIRKLLRGEVHYHQVTIPEGSNLFDTAEILHNAKLVTRDEFINAAGHADLIQDVAPGAVSLEGYLFPDTYIFEKHTPVMEIVQKMLERFRKFLTPEYIAAAKNQGLTLHQAVILASLIEKETAREDERRRISAVFHNRLRIHQRLECDPTVIYAALVTHQYRGKIYRSDMEIDSPFNTYLHSGLPLGPIANPGSASLLAAVQPEEADDLYFVSNNNGSHVFSKTLAQHQNAVQDYRHAVAKNAASREESATPRRSSRQGHASRKSSVP